jgi:integrase
MSARTRRPGATGARYRVTLHEARHAYSTFLDAAGVSPSRAGRYLGHSNGGVAERYRHELRTALADDAKRARHGAFVTLAAASGGNR